MTQQPTYYWNGNQYIWDRLRPFNSGLARDLKMLYEWDLEHPGEFVYYPRLCIEKDEIQSHEVAKLPYGGWLSTKIASMTMALRLVDTEF